jgi:prepilin-type N-terminal cleavage/methylation domain-containing protein
MRRRGVTLLELLIVVSLIGLLVGISYPSVSAGVDSLRLREAADGIAGLWNSALNRAERRQEIVELEIAPAEGRLRLRTSGAGELRGFVLPEGVRIRRLLPETPLEADQPRRFALFPGGTVPRVAIELENRRGLRRIVRVDPITGVPRIETGEAR